MAVAFYGTAKAVPFVKRPFRSLFSPGERFSNPRSPACLTANKGWVPHSSPVLA